MSIAQVSTERRISLLRELVEEAHSLEKAAENIGGMPLRTAREVADMYGYPIMERMSHSLLELQRMIGQAPPKPSQVVTPPKPGGFETFQRPTTTRGATLDNNSLSDLWARAEESPNLTTQAMGKRLHERVDALIERLDAEEQAMAIKAVAEAEAAEKRRKVEELKAQLAELDVPDAHPCPHPGCSKVYAYPKRLASHREKEGH